jgi:hypothetical protein
MLEDAPEALRAQLASGDVKVFINKTSGFTITTKHDTNPKEFGSLSQLFGDKEQGSRPGSAVSSGNSGSISSNSASTLGSSIAPIDSSPITPVSEGGGKFFLILLVLAILAAVMFFFLRRH